MTITSSVTLKNDNHIDDRSHHKRLTFVINVSFKLLFLSCPSVNCLLLHNSSPKGIETYVSFSLFSNALFINFRANEKNSSENESFISADLINQCGMSSSVASRCWYISFYI